MEELFSFHNYINLEYNWKRKVTKEVIKEFCITPTPRLLFSMNNKERSPQTVRPLTEVKVDMK